MIISFISGLLILVNGTIGLLSFIQLPQGNVSQEPSILLFLSIVSLICGLFTIIGGITFLTMTKKIGLIVIFAFVTASIAIPIIGNLLGFAMEVSFLGFLGAILGMVAVELLYHDMSSA